jgi:hypothetical protein
MINMNLAPRMLIKKYSIEKPFDYADPLAILLQWGLYGWAIEWLTEPFQMVGLNHGKINQ